MNSKLERLALLLISVVFVVSAAACGSSETTRAEATPEDTAMVGDPAAPTAPIDEVAAVLDDEDVLASDHEFSLPEIANSLLPMEQVASVMEMALVEEEIYPDLSQAFEHTDDTDLVEYVTAIYTGADIEVGAVGIDLAKYTSQEAASGVFHGQIEPELDISDYGYRLEVGEIEDASAAVGAVFPDVEDEGFTVTGVALQVDRVIAFITVLSYEEDGHQDQARQLAEELVHSLNR